MRHFARRAATVIALVNLVAHLAAGELVVRQTGGAPAVAAAGDVVRSSLILENGSAESRTVLVLMASVYGVELVSQVEERTIAAGDWDIVPIVARVSRNAPAQLLPVVYSAYIQSGTDRTQVAEGSLLIDVEPTPALAMQVPATPAFVLPDMQWPLEVELTNEGNVPLIVNLSVLSTGRSDVRFPWNSESQLPLEPGEQRTIILGVRASERTTSILDRIEISAVDIRYGVRERTVTEVEIVPQTPSVIDTWAHFPVTASVGTEIEVDEMSSAAVVGLGLSGRSRLGFTDDHELSFEALKHAATENPSLLHADDTFFVGYVGPVVALNIGDAQRARSPLLQSQTESRGVSISAGTGAMAVSADFARTLTDQPFDDSVTLSARWSPDTNSGVKTSIVAVSNVSGSGEPSVVAPRIAVAQSVAVGDVLAGEVEVALDTGAPWGFEASAARASISATGETSSLSIAGRFVGALMGAPSSDSWSLITSAAHAPGRGDVRLEGRVLLAEKNTTVGEVSAAIVRDAPFGFSVNASSRTEGEGFFSSSSQTTNSSGGSVSLAGDHVSVGLSGAFSRSATTAGPDALYATEASGEWAYRTTGSSLAITANHMVRDLSQPLVSSRSRLVLSTSESTESVSVTGSVQWEFPAMNPANSKLSLTGSVAMAIGDAGVLSGGVSWDRAISGSGAGSPVNTFGASIVFATPVSVPYARDPAYGSVTGTLVNMESGSPVAGALVRLGDRAAITRADGSFGFTALEPGSYRLAVDAQSIPQGLVVTRQAAEIEVEAGRSRMLQIGLAAASELRGRVRHIVPTTAGLLSSVEQSEWSEALGDGRAREVPLANRQVLLSNDHGSVITYSNAEGYFTVPALEPGTWQITVSSSRADENGEVYLTLTHEEQRTILNPGHSFEVPPGATVELDYVIVDKPRPIKVINGGEAIRSVGY